MTKQVRAPRGPVLSWDSFFGSRGDADVPAVDDAPHQVLATSGRAALFLAFRELGLAPGRAVLVPTYHCPTMVAPIVHAGLTPLFYSIDESGLPNLASIDDAAQARAGAFIVPHFFGYAQSLAAVRAWCDARGIALIEDCAHAFFGMAGERPVGAWGDVAIASVTKFFPVPEAGLLLSHQRPLRIDSLASQGAMQEARGLARLLQAAADAGRLGWISRPVRATAGLRRLQRLPDEPPAPTPANVDPLQGCDMSRSAMAPLALATKLLFHLPRAGIVARRRALHATLRTRLRGLPGCRILLDADARAVPYALPLWVDDADHVYQGLRKRGVAVFRWDFRWLGTPTLDRDCGGEWCHHVLQLLCHQELLETEVDLACGAVADLVSGNLPSHESCHRTASPRT